MHTIVKSVLPGPVHTIYSFISDNTCPARPQVLPIKSYAYEGVLITLYSLISFYLLYLFTYIIMYYLTSYLLPYEASPVQ